MDVQVVTNEKGKKTAVLIPIADWEVIQKRLNTEQLFDEFTSSMKSVKEDANGGTKLKNARNLIHGHRG
jgi:PHD/YefM family antitoxin component YafN of YafNO toxin-antitoxin module